MWLIKTIQFAKHCLPIRKNGDDHVLLSKCEVLHLYRTALQKMFTTYCVFVWRLFLVREDTTSQPLRLVYIYQMHSVVDFFCCNTRLHHHGCNVQDFSCQLQITDMSKPKCTERKANNTNHGDRNMTPFLLPCTLFSCLQCPREKGSWSVTSPSETAQTQISLCEGNKETTAITHMSILSEADELTQTGPCKAAVVSLSIFRCSINSDHHSWIYILPIDFA